MLSLKGENKFLPFIHTTHVSFYFSLSDFIKLNKLKVLNKTAERELMAVLRQEKHKLKKRYFHFLRVGCIGGLVVKTAENGT